MASKFDEALEALKPKRHSGSFQKGFDPKRNTHGGFTTDLIEVRRLLKNKHLAVAAERVFDLLSSDNDKVAMSAVELVMAYTLGKPVQPFKDETERTDYSKFTPEQFAERLEARAKELRAQREVITGSVRVLPPEDK